MSLQVGMQSLFEASSDRVAEHSCPCQAWWSNVGKNFTGRDLGSQSLVGWMKEILSICLLALVGGLRLPS